MKRKIKRNVVTTFAVAMATAMLMTSFTTEAAFTQRAKVNGEGVRLRRTPVSGTVLGLMYRPEEILIDDEVYDPNYSAWIYVKRVKNNTKGWMEWSYFVHN